MICFRGHFELFSTTNDTLEIIYCFYKFIYLMGLEDSWAKSLVDAEFYGQSTFFQTLLSNISISWDRPWEPEWNHLFEWRHNNCEIFFEFHWTFELIVQLDYDIQAIDIFEWCLMFTSRSHLFNEQSNVMCSREYQHDIIYESMTFNR